jgi:mono/diheme cytochrome c family protein
MEIPKPTEKNMSRGKTYYNYYCVFCHGEQGEGHGPVGRSYVPKPADLGADSIRNQGKEELYKSIFTGPGHEPVLDRVVSKEHRKYIMMYVQKGFE